MNIEPTWMIPLASLVLGWLGYLAARKKDIKTEGREEANVGVQLNYIVNGINDIKVDIKASEKRMIEHGERLTRVEESSKQAHKRIDKLEGREAK